MGSEAMNTMNQPVNSDNDITNTLKLYEVLEDKTCDLTRITSLTLINCQLCTIPDNLTKLNLLSLNLSHNRLTSPPGCLYNGMKSLRVLNLSHNSIEQFVSPPRCLLSLKSLNLSFNQFYNLPDWVLNFGCKSLEELSYSCNFAKNYDFDCSGYNMSNCRFRKLEFSNSCLKTDDLKFFTSISSLVYLDISNYDCNVKYVNCLGEDCELFEDYLWKNMKVLVLNNMPLIMLPDSLMFIESLRELYISGNHLSWLPDSIKNLVNLEILDVSNNNIGALNIALPSLRVLKAQYNSISEIITLKSELTYLDLYNNCLCENSHDILKFDCLDLEENYFDTNNLDNYREKLYKLRSNINEERYTGPKKRPSICESDYSVSDFDNEESHESFSYENCVPLDEENWDEASVINNYRKPPEITDSDDEWPGESVQNKTYKNVNKTLINEDSVYIDAPES